MEIIRESVFETNSSSTHSLIMHCSRDHKYRYETIIPDVNGLITFEGGDFSGAEVDAANPNSKANCIAVYISFTKNTDVKALFEKVVKNQTGAKRIEYNIHVIGANIDSFMSSSVMDCLESCLVSDLYLDSDCMDDEEEDGEESDRGQGVIDDEAMMKNFIFGQGTYMVGEISYG